MSGVAPMDAAAKAASAPAPQPAVGTPVPGPRLSASVPAGAAEFLTAGGAAGFSEVSVTNNYSQGVVTASASRGASPPRHAADGVSAAAQTTVCSSDGSDSDGSVTPPGEHDWMIGVEWPDGNTTAMTAPPDAPLRQSFPASLPSDGGWHLRCDGDRLSLDRTPRENGLVNGAVLQLCQSQRGGGPGDTTAVADDVEMAEASVSDDDESLSLEELGRRMVARGDPPPSPNSANEVLGLAYNAAVEAASAAAASASAAAAASSAAANSPAASASDGESDIDLDAELEYEAAIQAEQEPASSGEPAAGGAAPQAVQPQLQPARECSESNTSDDEEGPPMIDATGSSAVGASGGGLVFYGDGSGSDDDVSGGLVVGGGGAGSDDDVEYAPKVPEICTLCRSRLPTPFMPFENGMAPVCRGGECERRMREQFEQACQRAPEKPVSDPVFKQCTLAISTVLAQKGSPAQQRTAPREAETFVYAPVEANANPARMPSLLAPFRVRDVSRNGAVSTIDPTINPTEQLLVHAFGCGAGKSYQIFALIKDILSRNQRRPVLFVSCRKVHAGDLGRELGELGFLSYLEGEKAEGMGRRIKEHVAEQRDKELGARVVCSLNSIRALPKEYLEMFESQHGVLVYDEARSIAAYIREFEPNETCTFPRPDEVLDRLTKLAASSIVIVSDADALCDGTVLELARRVAPQKSIRCVCASRPMLERDVEIAFASNLDGKKCGTVADDNVGRRSFLHRIFAATRCARGNVEDRVYVQCAGKTQMERLKAMLEERGLWDPQRCKMYYGASPDKADLTNTAEAWADVYIVICNSAVTVAINIEVRFGAAFMLTSNDKSAVVRDMDQGIVRIWRKPGLEPRDGAMGRGPDGRCRIFALLGCAAPKGVLTAEAAGGGGGWKKGHVVAPIDFPSWQQREHAKALKKLRSGTAESQAKHGGAGAVLKPETQAIVAWNTVERKANTSQHLTYVLHLCSLGTRGWGVRCIEPFDDDAPAHPMPVCDEMDVEGGGDEADALDEAFDVAAADLAIRSFCGDEAKLYAWFVSTFVAFFGPPRFAFWQLTNAFFNTEGRYDEFVKTLKERDEHVDTGDGAMAGALKTIFQTLRPIQRIVESCEKEAAYMCLKHNEVALRRYASFRLFDAAELRARPLRVQLGVQQTDLVVLSILKRVASHLRLTIDDLLGFAPGQGGFSICGSDVPEAPIEMGREETSLDFTLRPPAGQGQQPGDMRCGGRWGFAGDVDERFNEDAASDAIESASKAISFAARALNIKMAANASPLTTLKTVLKETVQVELKMKRGKGTTVRGTMTNRQLKSLTLVQCANGLSERIELWHETTAPAPGARDDRAAERSPAWNFKEKQLELDANVGSAPLASADAPLTNDSAWQLGGLSADAAGQAQQAMHAVVAAQSEQQREWQHVLPLDVSGVEHVLAACRDAEAAGVTGCHPGVGSVTELLSPLTDALAGALDGGIVSIATPRDPEGCGPRRYVGAFNPLDAPPVALAVMLGGKLDCVYMEDARMTGALPLRLLQKHVHLQRQWLSGSSSAEPAAAAPSCDALAARLQAAQARVQELQAKVGGGDYSPPTLRGLAEATEVAQAAEAALASAQAGAQAAPSSTDGGSSAADGVLPSTAKLEALLRRGTGDCLALSRAVAGESPSDLSQPHKEVYYEVRRLVDALVAKGHGWEDLKVKLDNRKAGELRGLSGDVKARKEGQLKGWARTVLIDRLIDDAALLAEQQLAEQHGGAQYVQFLDARSRFDPTSVRLYVPRDAAGAAAPTQTLCLRSIGANVTLRLDNSGLDGVTAVGVAAKLRQLTEEAEAAAEEAAAAAEEAAPASDASDASEDEDASEDDEEEQDEDEQDEEYYGVEERARLEAGVAALDASSPVVALQEQEQEEMDGYDELAEAEEASEEEEESEGEEEPDGESIGSGDTGVEDSDEEEGESEGGESEGENEGEEESDGESTGSGGSDVEDVGPHRSGSRQVADGSDDEGAGPSHRRIRQISDGESEE